MDWVCAALINGKLAAFHKKESVMNFYLRNYKNSNPGDDVSFVKIKKKRAKKLHDYDAYYLVESNGIYIQYMYQDIHAIQYRDSTYEHLEEELKKLLSLKLKKKERKSLLESIAILEKKKAEYLHYTPSIQVLQEAYWMYEEYKNKTY